MCFIFQKTRKKKNKNIKKNLNNPKFKLQNVLFSVLYKLNNPKIEKNKFNVFLAYFTLISLILSIKFGFFYGHFNKKRKISKINYSISIALGSFPSSSLLITLMLFSSSIAHNC